MVRLLLPVVLVAACSRGTLVEVPRGPFFPQDDAAPHSSAVLPVDAGPWEDGDTLPLPYPDTGADVAIDTGADVAIDTGADVAIDAGADVAIDTGADVAIDTGADVATDTGADVAIDTGADVAVDVGGHGWGVEFVAPHNDTDFRTRVAGDLFEDACDSGEALIGLHGNYATHGWFAQVGGVCGRPSVSCSGTSCNVTVDRTENRPLLSGTGTYRTWEVLCPLHHLVTGFGGRTGANIDMLGLRCSPLEVTVEGSDHSLRLGPYTDVDAVGNHSGDEFPQTDCLPGTAATVTRTYALTNYHRYVSALSFRCQTPAWAY